MTGQRVVDLHDAGSLIAADSTALLPAAALAGAQVRSCAEQLSSWPAFERPRAFVVVGAGAAVDAGLLAALIGDRSPAPIVAVTALPGWVGPLDIVVVLASSVDDFAAAEAAARADRRGARVVVRSAAQGPVASAAAGALLEPLLSVPEALAGAARLTVLAEVAAAAGLYPRPDFGTAADQLDALAMACHPSSEFFVNPALTLAEHLSAGTPLFIGTDPIADALALHGCRALAGLAGYAAAALASAQAAASPPILGAAAGRGSGAATYGGADVFYDPYDDDNAESGQQLAPVLLVGPAGDSGAGPLIGSGLLPTDGPAAAFGSGPPGAGRSPLAAALVSAVPRAMSIGEEEVPSAAPAQAARPDDPAGVRQRDAFTWAVAMQSRIDFAAVYLGLLSGARPPIDAPDGLGRPGRNAPHPPGPGESASAPSAQSASAQSSSAQYPSAQYPSEQYPSKQWSPREPGSWS